MLKALPGYAGRCMFCIIYMLLLHIYYLVFTDICLVHHMYFSFSPLFSFPFVLTLWGCGLVVI